MDKSKIAQFIEEKGSRPEKIRTSVYLTSDEYKNFQKFCEQKNVSPSEVLDFFIKDFNKEHISKIAKKQVG